ncbi:MULTISPECIES: TetR family transcriptional regulator C-terminal domain-containing protein [Clavibacter]|uniref:TetR family transcriptional regulator n=2 Tax=Clavibacter TaxID=1573 RepID=A0A399NNP1_9MICO|nr:MULTISPECIES: TetR/AcrR family transcriptional regulator [Clavibacter]KDP92586.1 TetR family transcriptional regulator [Clavibacter cf. michiganensis LMG 26808]RII95803.1 TetR family transcriptional regulator [Clavibacter michiganensis]UKF25268.1 TetR family transcriptional regulator [Clavibacter sp. A6099]
MSAGTGTSSTAGTTAATATRRGGKREKPEVRRAMIVEAARAVILRRGLTATGLRDIAAEGDVSVGTVTYHFSSVAEILDEVVVLETDRFYASIVEEVDAEPDAVHGIRMLVEPLFAGTDASEAHWRLWSDYWTAVARQPGLSADRLERIRVWEACLVRTIRRGVVGGVFRTVDAAEVALKLAAYSDGIATQLSQKVPGLDHARALEWIWTFLDHELADPAAGEPLFR